MGSRERSSRNGTKGWISDSPRRIPKILVWEEMRWQKGTKVVFIERGSIKKGTVRRREDEEFCI